MIKGGNEALLKKYEDELADLFIVSHALIGENQAFRAIASFESDAYTVEIQKATGEKCQRCWKYRELNKDGLCHDCIEAIQ